MEKINTTAKTLDRVVHVLGIALSIAAIVCLVGLLIIGAGFLFELEPDQIGTGYDVLNVGSLELQLTAEYAPDTTLVLLHAAVKLLLFFAVLLLARGCVKSIRGILQPMAQGKPFLPEVSVNLNKMAIYTLFLGIAMNGIRLAEHLFLVCGYDLQTLLRSERIAQATVEFSAELGFLVICAVLMLLSYVFRYGESLQKLSDETL